MRSRSYWCENTDVAEVIKALHTKREDYYSHLQSTGRLDVWRTTAQRYYGYNQAGVPYRSASVEFGGQYGEVALVQANEVRGLVDDFLVLVTGTRLAVQPVARNSDGTSLRATELAKSLHDFYSDRKGLETAQVRTAFYAALFGEGYSVNRWNTTKGAVTLAEPVMLPDGTLAMQAVTEGDIEILSRHPLDVVSDPLYEEAGWYLVRSYANRFDLAALFPDARDRLMDCEPASRTLRSNDRLWMSTGAWRQTNDDIVCCESLYVPRSPAIPSGRHLMIAGGTVDLYDTALEGEMPVQKLLFEQEMESPFGSTRVTNILELQEVLDSTLSTWLTSHDAFGIPTIYVGPDGGLAPTDLRLLRMIKGPSEPKVMSFGNMGDGSQKLAEFVLKRMQAQMGLNSVSRGEPDAKMSGTAYALLASMAAKAVAGFQRNYAIDTVEWNANQLINNVKLFLPTQKMIDIAGRGEAARAMEFKADDLSPIVRMRVDINSAVNNSLANRQDVADKLLQAKVINRDEYLEARKTGYIAPLDDASAALAKAKSENEFILEWAKTPEAQQWHQQFLMSQQQSAAIAAQVAQMAPGLPPPPPMEPPPLPPEIDPIVFEQHGPHARVHSHLSDDPAAKKDPIVMAIASVMVTKHAKLRREMDPVLAELTRQEPLLTPPAPPPMMLPQGPGNPDDTQARVPGVTDNPMGPNGKMPNMPRSPLDGQQPQ